MFKELPAWGFYIRHARGISMENVKLVCEKKDYRTAVVLDDVQGASFRNLQVTEPGGKKDGIFSYRSTEIEIKK